MADGETFGGRIQNMFSGRSAQPDPFLTDGQGAPSGSSASKPKGDASSDLPWSLWGSSSPRAQESVPKQKPVRQGEVISRKGSRSGESGKDREPRVYRERVLVRVYDLGKTMVTQGLNRTVKSYGAFHSGVEIYGREWSFGMTFDEWSTGITWNPPGDNPDHKYLETLSMGYTNLSPTQVWQIIEEMKVQWRGHTYHLLTRNCHHFTNAFCQKLGVGSIPPWLNDLAGTGAATVEFLDSADSGYDGGEAITDFFSSMKRGFYNAFSWDSGTNGSEALPQPKGRFEQAQPAPQKRHDPFAKLR